MATITIKTAGREFSPKEFKEEGFGPQEAKEIKTYFSCPYCGYEEELCFHHFIVNNYKYTCDSCGGQIPFTKDVFPSDKDVISPSGTDYLQDHLTSLEGFVDIPNKNILRLYVKYQKYLITVLIASMIGIIFLLFSPELIGAAFFIGIFNMSLVVISYIAEKQFKDSWENPPVTFKMLLQEPYRSLYLSQYARKKD